MRSIGLCAALTLAGLLSGPEALASDYSSPVCYWRNPVHTESQRNVFYPDTGAIYWAGWAPFFDGEIVFRGEFPHARYMSFNVYDENLAPIDALADVEIQPDAGSSHPFLEGGDRTAPNRSYTIRLRAGPKPEGPAPNTLYASIAGLPTPSPVLLLYRIYVPDDVHRFAEPRDLTAGVGLPQAELVFGNGTTADLTERCDPAALRGENDSPVPLLDDLFNEQRLPPIPGVTYPAHDPLRWEKFFNLPHVQAALGTEGTPVRPLVDQLLGFEQGGYLSNADNAYVVSIGNRGLGEYVVLRGRLPSTPATRSGEAIMGAGQVRYVSLCTNERNSTRWVDCLFDEEIATDADGFFKIVVSARETKPSDAALAGCGAQWLNWGTSPELLLILRHMLPDPGFPEAIQNVPGPSMVRQHMGDYLPIGRHASPETLQAVCNQL